MERSGQKPFAFGAKEASIPFCDVMGIPGVGENPGDFSQENFPGDSWELPGVSGFLKSGYLAIVCFHCSKN